MNDDHRQTNHSEKGRLTADYLHKIGVILISAPVILYAACGDMGPVGPGPLAWLLAVWWVVAGIYVIGLSVVVVGCLKP